MNDLTNSLPDVDRAATMGFPPGQSVDSAAVVSPVGFEMLDEVGHGGMGVVHRARDLVLDREVAVKVLRDKYAPVSGTAARFVEEARITAQLQHPGIPAVYQVGVLTDGRPYLAMKLIKGRTLDELVKKGKPLDTLGVFEAVCHAVGYAHAHGVIHRDLKPHNIMVGAFGEVQVMDWGLAKVLANRSGDGPGDAATTAAGTEIRTPRDSDTPFTQYGSALGTPAYMPPEQAAGELDKVDRRSDVFGLGAILCVLLTGKPPFDGRDGEAIRLNAVRGKTGDALARLDACGADPEVVALCKRCLAFEPADRPATADEVATAVAALRRAADDRARQAERDKLAAEVREGEQRKRRRTIQRYAGAVAAVLLLGVAGTTVGLIRADSARWDAEAAERDAIDARGEAEQKTADAVVARGEAERMAADATAVRSLLEDILKQGSSDGRGAAGLKVEAGVTVKQAMDYTARSVGERFKDQPRVEGEVRDILGTMYHKLGAFREAAEQLEKAVEVRRRALGPDAEDTLKSLNNLAVVYRALGRTPEAERAFLDVLAAKRRVLGNANRSTLTTINNLGNLYLTQKDYVRAEAYFQEALDGRRQTLGDDDLDTQISFANAAAVRLGTDRHAEALPLFQAAAAGFTKKLSRDAATTLKVVRNLATCHSRLGHREQAETLLLEVVSRSAALQPSERKLLLPDAAKEIVALYDGWNRPADAATWRDKLKEYLPVAREPAPPPRPVTAK